MGRAPRYPEDDILDAALALVEEEGVQGASVAAIARRLGAPSGSIYHRFASRDLVMATLWVRTVRQFQHGLLVALRVTDLAEAARRAALHTVEWAGSHRREARLLTLHRRQDLLADWPDELGEDLATLNDEVAEALVAFARRRCGRADAEALARVRFALVEIPYAAARQVLLADQPLPWLGAAVVAASRAALERAESGCCAPEVAEPSGP